MRVIAGKARRTMLKTVEGMETRPTTDRIKETLFNMLQYDLYDCSFLDLFAGSGAIGIEALSRGCKNAVFVEKSKNAQNCIKENLLATKLVNDALVLSMDAVESIGYLEGMKRSFQFIFMDPPYNQDLERQVLERLRNSTIIDEDTLIIVEASLETWMDDIDTLGFEIVKEKKYKTNKHIFIKKQ